MIMNATLRADFIRQIHSSVSQDEVNGWLKLAQSDLNQCKLLVADMDMIWDEAEFAAQNLPNFN